MATNIATISGGNVPAHIKARMNTTSAVSDTLSDGLYGEAYNRISIRQAKFRIMLNGEEHKVNRDTLDVVIVGANPGRAKQFYLKPYNAEAAEGPDCFSYDGVTPNKRAPSPQCASCATCPKNVWGSATTAQGKETKACSDQKRLAVVLADHLDKGVFLLTVPPSALKSLSMYTRELKKYGVPPECIRTQLSFDDDASFPRLLFSNGDWLTEDEQAKVDAFVGSEETARIIGVEHDTVVVDSPAKPVLESPVKQAAEAPLPGTVPRNKTTDQVTVAEGEKAAALASELGSVFD